VLPQPAAFPKATNPRLYRLMNRPSLPARHARSSGYSHVHLRRDLRCQIKPRWGVATLCLIVMSFAFGRLLGVEHGAGSEQTPPISASTLSRAIDLSAVYLERACDARGRFAYRVDPTSGRESHSYNIIRHAGAIYSLAMLNRFQPDQKAADAMVRAGSFLQNRYLNAGPGEDMFAVWSKPAGVGLAGVADLGATGLGIVALTSIQRAKPNEIPVSELEAMGRFLTFLQKSDGSFYSKYRVDTGPVKSWQSLYFPGEAILGLVSLYEVDHNRQWLVAAGKGLSFLAKSRAATQEVPPDHWALIASAEFLPFYEQSECPATREELLRHAILICRSLLAGQITSATEPDLDGSFNPDGRTAPTATRLEGLLAALEFLPKNDSSGLRAAIDKAVQSGINFLLRAQIKSGQYAGGMPGAIPREDAGVKQPEPRSSDVRIDYVQHALCAFLRYQQMFLTAGGQPAHSP